MKNTNIVILFFVIFSSACFAGDLELIKLNDLFKDEVKEYGTKYLSEEERKNYEIEVNTFGEVTNSSREVLDTSNLPSGGAMFVYSKAGKIYLSTKERLNKFVHSSLVGGEDVIVAGTMQIIRGQVIFITDISIRYVPKTSGNLYSVLEKLKELGAETDDINVYSRPIK